MYIPAEDDLIKVKISARAAGQAVDNTLWYRVSAIGATAGVGLDAILQEFVSDWQDDVIVGLSASYEALLYEAWALGPIKVKNPGGPKGGQPLYRWKGQTAIEGGEVADTGGVAGAALPTYVCATIRKVSSGVDSTAYANELPAGVNIGVEKLFKGFVNIGTLPETYTEAADQNILTAAATTALQNAFTVIMGFTAGGLGTLTTVAGVVTSMYQDGFIRFAAATPTSPFRAVMAYQPLSSCVLNDTVGSRTSRKQKRAGA